MDKVKYKTIKSSGTGYAGNDINIRLGKQIINTDPSMRAKRQLDFCLVTLPAGMNIHKCTFYNYLILLRYLLHRVKCTTPNIAP